VSLWSWLKLTAVLWLIRKGFKVAGWLLVAAAAIAAWPLTAVAVLGYLAAWLCGWPPARLWHAAAWALPMTAIYAIGEALRLRAWQAVALAPVSDWLDAWGLLAAHAILRAGLLVAPIAVPAGLAVAGVGWAWRIYAITTGLAGLTASAPIEFDARQWRRQAHTATSPFRERRAILLAADDYSAVSRRVPISNLYERGRSLGLGVQVSAQSWQGLGRDDDERYRIAATADGGIWLMHNPYPSPSPNWPAPGGCWSPRTRWSARPRGGKAPPGLSTRGSPTRT
jgi:hypothetical protein